MSSTTTASAFERVDALTLVNGGNQAAAVLMHPDEAYGYVISRNGGTGTLGQPARITKIDLRTFDPVQWAGIGPEEEWALLAAIDSSGRYAYVSYENFHPGTPGDEVFGIAKIDLDTLQWVATTPTVFYPTSLVLDPAGENAYIGTWQSTVIQKVDLASMQLVGSIDTGDYEIYASTIDPDGRYGYFATINTRNIFKVDLAQAEVVDMLTVDEPVVRMRSAFIDRAGAFAYFGSDTLPGHVLKLDLATFQVVDTLTLPASEGALQSAILDPSGQVAYFKSDGGANGVIAIGLEPFVRIAMAPLGGDTVGYVGSVIGSASVAVDSTGEFVYASTADTPAKVVKLAVQEPAPYALAFEPEGVDFYNAVPGGGSSGRSFLLHNVGSQTITGLEFGPFDSPFAVDVSECGSMLASGATCAVHASFAPDAEGSFERFWSASGDQAATAHVQLRGRGVSPDQVLSFEPRVLDFGEVDVGSVSEPLIASLTNGSAVPVLNPMFLVITPAFGELVFGLPSADNDCGTVIDAGSSCTVTIRFRPTLPGLYSDSLKVNAPSASAQLALSGTGRSRPDALVFESLVQGFGDVPVGNSARRSVILRNWGSNSASGMTYSISNDRFSVSDPCLYVAHGGACSVEIQFTPTIEALEEGVLRVTAAEGAVAEIHLTGTGVGDGEEPIVEFDPVAVEFGQVPVGTTSAPRIALLRNPGTEAVPIQIMPVSLPNFSVDASGCGPMLPVDTSCPIGIAYTPDHVQVDKALLVVRAGSSASFSLPLSGEGIEDILFRDGFD
jgi:DNA-binding beta-propeller fold protein YncE